ncbi:MAG TPA: hypothetical protein VN446_06885 [Candidatus Acidoferrum sp.]|nr:hypothetical protein [Candidatus Acidoferrum sp.]
MPFWEVPDNPVVANLCRTGTPDGKEPRPPRCPWCGREADTLYIERGSNQILGCGACVKKADAYEFFDENL